MLKKIFLLCFLLSGFLFAQQYTNEKYEKYVGTKLGKYPLTVTGLKKAINALDSGVVYISYPGLWDTTGLGTIPTKIQLNGWLFGDLINYFDSPSLNRMIFTRGSDSLDQIYSSSLADGARNNGTYIFYDNKLSWWGNLMAVSFQRENALVVHPSSRTLNADFVTWVINKGNPTYSVTNFQTVLFLKNPDATGYNTNAYMIGRFNAIQLKNVAKGTIKDFILSRHTLQMGAGDTLTVSNKIVGVQTDVSDVGGGTAHLKGDYYAFYSPLTNTYLIDRIIGNKYHFYGDGNYPSYFGGTVNSSAGYNYSADTSSTDDYKIVIAGAHTLIAGLEVTFKASTANDSTATLQINSLFAQSLTKASSGAINTSLATGDILAGQIVKAVYDGTQFQIISRLAQ